MYRLVITELAQNDLDGIVKYIAQQLGNLVAAGSFLKEVETCYGYLRSNPFIYAKSADWRLEQEGYRRAQVKNYLLFFKVSEENETVTVYRFLYGARDYISLL